MEPILKISASSKDIRDHFDMFQCFLSSGEMLFATAYDGIVAYQTNQAGKPTPEYWNRLFITSIYLLRHSLELAVKALIKEKTSRDIWGHNIKKMWEDNVKDSTITLDPTIKLAFEVLKKIGVLEDEELYRYHQDNKGVTLQAMQPIENRDFGLISQAIWTLYQEILEIKEVKYQQNLVQNSQAEETA